MQISLDPVFERYDEKHTWDALIHKLLLGDDSRLDKECARHDKKYQ